jgi:hypothetical protein
MLQYSFDCPGTRRNVVDGLPASGYNYGIRHIADRNAMEIREEVSWKILY